MIKPLPPKGAALAFWATGSFHRHVRGMDFHLGGFQLLTLPNMVNKSSNTPPPLFYPHRCHIPSAMVFEY